MVNPFVKNGVKTSAAGSCTKMAKMFKIKLVAKLKISKRLKVLPYDMRTNSKVLVRFEMAGMPQHK